MKYLDFIDEDKSEARGVGRGATWVGIEERDAEIEIWCLFACLLYHTRFTHHHHYHHDHHHHHHLLHISPLIIIG